MFRNRPLHAQGRHLQHGYMASFNLLFPNSGYKVMTPICKHVDLQLGGQYLKSSSFPFFLGNLGQDNIEIITDFHAKNRLERDLANLRYTSSSHLFQLACDKIRTAYGGRKEIKC